MFYKTITEDAETKLADLERQVAEARADLAQKQALTPAQTLATEMHNRLHRWLCEGEECYWETEGDYNVDLHGLHAWTHERFLARAEVILTAAGNIDNARVILAAMGDKVWYNN